MRTRRLRFQLSTYRLPTTVSILLLLFFTIITYSYSTSFLDIGDDRTALAIPNQCKKDMSSCLPNHKPPSNEPPVANAGTDQTVNPSSIVTLDGSRSRDPDKGQIKYYWRQIGGPIVNLDDADKSIATFTAPSNLTADTTLAFRLIVNDDKNATGVADVKVTDKYIPPPNQSPVANAGTDQVTSPGNVIALNGTLSKDPDNDPLRYHWLQIAGHYVKLEDANTATPSFIAPSNISSNLDLIFKLTVYDSKNATDIDDVKITDKFIPTPILNFAPIANAGSYQIVNENVTYVILNGSESYDKNGYITSYSWRQLSGPRVKLTDIHDPTPVFNIPQVSVDTPLTFALVVTDDHGVSSNNSAIAHVLIKNAKPLSHPEQPGIPDKPPVAEAGPNQVSSPGNSVVLNGTSSNDPDNDLIKYHWLQIAGPHVRLDGANMVTSLFIAPSNISNDTDLMFKLTVTDSKNATGVDYVKVTDKKPGSGYDRGCKDAKIPNPSDRYINQSGKGPRDHSDEFMSQYKKGFNDCSKGIAPVPQLPPGNTEPPQNLPTCKDRVVLGIGEINTSPIGHGLRINVDIAGADGSHPARINVTGPYGETLCHDMELTSADQSMLFYFYPDVIPNGQRFEACITLLDTNKKSCVEGLNHSGRQSESVQLHPLI